MNKQKGTVKWFNAKKGYGFIARKGKADLFVHFTGIATDGYRELAADDEVEFVVEESKISGRDHAVEVTVIKKEADSAKV